MDFSESEDEEDKEGEELIFFVTVFFFLFSSGVFADFSFDVDFGVGLEVDFLGTFVVAFVLRS